MAITKAILIIVEGNHLPDAFVTTLSILINSARVAQKPKMPEPEVSVVATKAVAIKTMVIAMVGVMGKPVVRPMPWMPMIRRGI